MTTFQETILVTLGHAPEQIEPGRMVRFATSDRRGDKSGWARLFDDGEGGVFGCWRTGVLRTWQKQQPKTDEERQAWTEMVRRNRERAERALADLRADCRQKSSRLWARSRDVDPGSPYVVAKGIKPYGARQLWNSLLIPVRGADGALRGLQFIAGDGAKVFKSGTEITGSYCRIGSPKDKTLIVAEGWATGCTLHEATGHAVAVAFNAGNLPPVCHALRAKFPDWRLIVCADDDHATAGNPGVTKATEAARAVGGVLVVPNFAGVERGTKDSDFNDLARLAGLDAVGLCVERFLLSKSAATTEEIVAGVESGDDMRRTPYQLASSTADLRQLDVKIEYIVEGLIPKGFITLFYASSGLGKSTLANQLCQAVQDGSFFLGLSTVQTPVFYLDYENPLATIVDRLKKVGGRGSFPLWHHGSEVPPPQLDEAEEREVLLDIEPETLVVIDTLKACNDLDENKAGEMKQLFDFIKALRRHGLTILLLHHTTKGPDGTYRGSSVIQDQADHCISLSKVKAAGSDQEANDDDDTATYRLGVKGKTRARPFRMFLEFDPAAELFVSTVDPGLVPLQKIGEVIGRITARGESPIQSRIVAEMVREESDEFSERRVRELLKRGTGLYWQMQKGEKNANIFSQLPKFGSLSAFIGASNCQTESGPKNDIRPLSPQGNEQVAETEGFDSLTGTFDKHVKQGDQGSRSLSEKSAGVSNRRELLPDFEF